MAAQVFQLQPTKCQKQKHVGSHADRRPREWLTEDEIKSIIKAIPSGWGQERNRLLILFAYHHGLRASEISRMCWSDVDRTNARVTIRRLKGSESGVHPIPGDELRALRAWQRHQEPKSSFIFTGWNVSPITRQTIFDIVEKAGARANLGFSVHPHMLRHSVGYYLINSNQDIRIVQAYLGHKSIANTVRYTALNASRFDGLWK